jgi:ABC-type transporter Mla subunit MlaD
MRRILSVLALVACGGAAFAASVSADEETHTYKLEMYNAFGLVEGSEVKVAGVNAGVVKSLEVSENKTALVEVELTGPLAVLGEDTRCSSEPQSLIAEYFIDCQPAGPPAEEGSVLEKKVSQTVQTDLVQNTLREPFKDRLALLINEFGTALAGNPENLNEAIRLGAPALEDLHDALRILGRQNTVLRNLNVNSDRIIGRLADRREDVAAFVENAGAAAAASAERSEDLRANFDRLDDFLAELEPTMAELENVALESTPLLSDLRGAAPQLNELATSLPAFNRATQRSLTTLGDAAVPGRRAMRRGVKNGTFRALRDSFDQAPIVSELLKDFLNDIDDPRRIVELDERAAKTCDDKTLPCYKTGREGPTGYLGTEGVLNYIYYLAGALNQYDSVGHLLHFSLYDVFAGPCGSYNPQQSYPANGGGRTNNLLEAEECVSWLGRNQPGITPGHLEEDLGIPPYDPAVCPDGSTRPDICDPNAPRRRAATPDAEEARRVTETGEGPALDPGADLPDLPGNLPGAGNPAGSLDDVLDGLPGGLSDKKKGKGGGALGGGGGTGGTGQSANDLLDFLFKP